MSRIRSHTGRGFGLQLAAASVLMTLAAMLVLLVATTPNAQAASSAPAEQLSRATLQVVSPPVQPLANPPLPLSCTGSFSLVFDTSGSFTQGDLNSVKSDAQAFVAAVLAVDSSASFRIAHFATSSGVTEPGSSDLGTINAAIDNVPNVGGFTNWAAGISAGAGVDHLIVLTDGNPNRPGASTTVNDSAIIAAINAANVAKNAGAHITVVGIDTSGEPPAGFDADSVLRAGWVASPDAVFTTTVGLLPSILDQIAATA